LALFQIRKLSDDKYLVFIMTHFLLIMPYQWYGIKANVMRDIVNAHNNYSIASWDFILCHVVPRDLFYFTPYVKIPGELDKNAS